MGSSFSGRHSGAPIIEHGLKLDIRRLRKQGLFRPGQCRQVSISWSSGSSVRLVFEPDVMRILYNANGQPVTDRVSLAPFPQPFGGNRWYFICPSTGKRCQCLYMPTGASRFRSRQAFSCRLLYLSQTLAPESRYQEQARRIARRVFEAWPAAWRLENEEKWDFPPKPPWMRWKTYRRLDQRYEAYEEASAGNWIERIARILARC
jgi:hypothetical protein